MPNYAFTSAGVARDGQAAWIDGKPYTTIDRPRGCVCVDDDNRRHFYRVSRDERKAFRQWAESAFSGMNANQLAGAWPVYHVRHR